MIYLSGFEELTGLSKHMLIRGIGLLEQERLVSFARGDPDASLLPYMIEVLPEYVLSDRLLSLIYAPPSNVFFQSQWLKQDSRPLPFHRFGKAQIGERNLTLLGAVSFEFFETPS